MSTKPLLDCEYFQGYRIGRLYFKYVKDTPLEKEGWTAEQLALELEKAGFIQIIEIQPQGAKGWWQKKERRYVELPGKSLSRKTFLQMLYSKQERRK